MNRTAIVQVRMDSLTGNGLDPAAAQVPARATGKPADRG